MAVEFLWGERAERTRGPKPKLSLDQIADAAIGIADAEGLAAVSMQRVAADLGYTKMSLYRYLPGKTELVALMVERALGEPPPLAGQDWRAALAEWCRQLLAGFVRHPWTLEATVGVRPLGPHEVGWMESALTVLAGTPLTGGERLDAMVLLVGHARMLAEQTAARSPEVVASDRPRIATARSPEVASDRPRIAAARSPEVVPDRPRAAVAAGSEEQLSAVIATVIAEHGDRFPQLKSAMAEAAATGGQNQAFHFGLERILDGLETLIRSRSPNRSD
ncbi:MAG TPA: TetR/AcrR family transcriptional regulator [Actinoplanes sp.]|nr:TetR/AcrR family transcriptional regulator [Actinoplanes sp.]